MVMRQRLLLVTCATVLIAFAWALFGPARPAEASTAFVAPLPAPLTVLRGFDPPAQPWLPGNRGVDLAATTGESVVAAADGVVLYAGELAGRGVVSIDHGGLRTTYEPVDPAVARGGKVRRGQVIGRVAAVADGCGPPGGCLHWGAIRDGAYLDPLSLLAVPQVRLLPIWADGLPTAPPDNGRAAVVTPPPVSATTPLALAAGPPGEGGTRVSAGPDIAAGPGVAAGSGVAAGLGVGIGAAGLWRARRLRRLRRLRRPSGPGASSARKLPAL